MLPLIGAQSSKRKEERAVLRPRRRSGVYGTASPPLPPACQWLTDPARRSYSPQSSLHSTAVQRILSWRDISASFSAPSIDLHPALPSRPDLAGPLTPTPAHSCAYSSQYVILPGPCGARPAETHRSGHDARPTSAVYGRDIRPCG